MRERSFSNSDLSIIKDCSGEHGNDRQTALPETVGQWVLMPQNHLLVCRGRAEQPAEVADVFLLEIDVQRYDTGRKSSPLSPPGCGNPNNTVNAARTGNAERASPGGKAVARTLSRTDMSSSNNTVPFNINKVGIESGENDGLDEGGTNHITDIVCNAGSSVSSSNNGSVDMGMVENFSFPKYKFVAQHTLCVMLGISIGIGIGYSRSR